MKHLYSRIEFTNLFVALIMLVLLLSRCDNKDEQPNRTENGEKAIPIKKNLSAKVKKNSQENKTEIKPEWLNDYNKLDSTYIHEPGVPVSDLYVYFYEGNYKNYRGKDRKPKGQISKESLQDLSGKIQNISRQIIDKKGREDTLLAIFQTSVESAIARFDDLKTNSSASTSGDGDKDSTAGKILATTASSTTNTGVNTDSPSENYSISILAFLSFILAGLVAWLYLDRGKLQDQYRQKIAGEKITQSKVEKLKLEIQELRITNEDHLQEINQLNKQLELTALKNQPVLTNSTPVRNQPKPITPPREVVNVSSTKNKIVYEPNKDLIANKHWLVTSASVPGASHIKHNIPCQDNHFIRALDGEWGIAVSCDGAGSAENSHFGSAFVAKTAIPQAFIPLLKKQSWYSREELPTQSDWELIAHQGIVEIYNELKVYASTMHMPFQSLACTVIITIFSKKGLLVTHIGDGRAGYADDNGNWFAMLKPHKGDESNQTVFLTSMNWEQNELEMSGVSVPQSRLIEGPISAFVLMSDGCEMHSFKCSVLDPKTQQWTDPNLPYPTFFNPLVSKFLTIAKERKTSGLENQWESFLTKGNEALLNEPDDKTMVLGVAL